MTHASTTQEKQDPYEKCAIQFQLPNAIIWQIKFILSSLFSKKYVATASSEFNLVSHPKHSDSTLIQLSEQFGKDFDKYLLKELMD